MDYNNNNKWPLTPKSMTPTGDEHAKLKTYQSTMDKVITEL